MIYLTGDIHGSLDIHKLNAEMFVEQKNMNKNDYLIILGDFGLTWNNGDDCKYWLDWLNNKNFTTLFIDGNHENFFNLYQYPTIDFLGGKTHQIKSSIYHLMRGEIFTIENSTFFVMGGGISIDRAYRIDGLSWWKEEIPSYAEIENGFSNLKKYNNRVDYVLTHSAPTDISLKILSHHCEEDVVTKILDKFKEKIDFKKWYFGHHHQNKIIDDKFELLYSNIIKVNH